MSGNLLDTPSTVGCQVYLSPSPPFFKDLFYGAKMLLFICAEREGGRLLKRIDLVLDSTETIQDLLIAIEIDT